MEQIERELWEAQEAARLADIGATERDAVIRARRGQVADHSCSLAESRSLIHLSKKFETENGAARSVPR